MRISTCALILLACSAASAVEITPVHLEGLLQPQVAVGTDGSVQVVGVTPDDGGSDVVYCRRGADGTFSALRTVNDQPKSATCIGTIRGARLALGRGGIPHVAWNGRDGKAFWYSRDFAPARNLLATGDGVDGGGAVAADGAGRVAIVFHHQAGAAKDEGRQVASVTSDDDGVTLSAARPMTLPAVGVCGCCSLAADLDGTGRIELLFRNAAKGSRDLWFVGGDGRSRVLGPWTVQSCPMSSAAIVHHGTATYFAWEQQGQVWWCQAGRTAVSAGLGKYPALAVDAAGTVIIAWAAGTGWSRGGDVRWQAYGADGATIGPAGTQTGLPAWGAPAVVADAPGRFTVLW